MTAAFPPAGKTILRRSRTYPGAKKDTPWGDIAVKVNGKAFIFMGMTEGEFSMTVKLPSSGLVALNLPFASPTGYGLGKAGWVSARFPLKSEVPVAVPVHAVGRRRIFYDVSHVLLLGAPIQIGAVPHVVDAPIAKHERIRDRVGIDVAAIEQRPLHTAAAVGAAARRHPRVAPRT